MQVAAGALRLEDDEIDLESILRGFKRMNVTNRVVNVGDGLGALAAIRGEYEGVTVKAPYVVLLDLNTPTMARLEFLSELRSDAVHGRAPVFVFTNSERPEDTAAARVCGISGYFVKPVSIELLLRSLQDPLLLQGECQRVGPDAS